MTPIKINQVINGTLIREGAGVKLHRYIGADRQNNFEPFLLFDYFDSSDPMDFIAGFPAHPHRGFETITYLLDGQIAHEDNKGHSGLIGPGEVQWMTAGRGIIHSEMPRSSSGRLRGLQFWLNLPAAKKWAEPYYQEVRDDKLPIETLDSGVVIKVIAGTTALGICSPIVGIATEPLFFDIQIPPDRQWTHSIAESHQAILFVLEGELFIEQQKVSAKVLAVLGAGDQVTLQSMDKPTRCLLLTAKKLKEPIARLGPFVMNTQEEVQQALEDFRANNF